ncbi:O-antigen ligase family protein [Bacteroides rodentium]|jgi:O-antigen ligase
MGKLSRNISITPSMSGVVNVLLIVGLLLIAYCIVMQRWYFLTVVLFLPTTLIILLYATKRPIFSYVLLGAVTCYFSAIYRYSGIKGLSIIMEILILFCLFSIITNKIAYNKNYPIKRAFNIYTIAHFVWLSYCFLILITPYATLHNFIDDRALYFTLPLTYILSGLLLCGPKQLRATILLYALFVLTAAFKAYWQKRKGFDSAELKFLLIDGGYSTHILRTGMRYFSFFTDAGNFGASMGIFTTTFGIITTAVKRPVFKIVSLGITILAFIGMLLSGTRGAIIVPIAGLVLYLLLSKSLVRCAVAGLTGVLIFCFFSYTDIGESNVFIKRMRTAFRPSQDASFNVRLDNQRRFAYYLADKPFGMGVGGKVVDTQRIRTIDEEFIPTDSFYVGVWVEGGIVGLLLYISLQILVLLRCCYLLMFKIRHKQLRHILSALLCAVFGVWVNGYVGRCMEFQPGMFTIAVFISLVLNGPIIERKLKKDEIII